jgi:hypothetical protein
VNTNFSNPIVLPPEPVPAQCSSPAIYTYQNYSTDNQTGNNLLVGNKLYLAGSELGSGTPNIKIIDVTTNNVIRTITTSTRTLKLMYANNKI